MSSSSRRRSRRHARARATIRHRNVLEPITVSDSNPALEHLMGLNDRAQAAEIAEQDRLRQAAQAEAEAQQRRIDTRREEAIAAARRWFAAMSLNPGRAEQSVVDTVRFRRSSGSGLGGFDLSATTSSEHIVTHFRWTEDGHRFDATYEYSLSVQIRIAAGTDLSAQHPANSLLEINQALREEQVLLGTA
jgi:hypothetical protein